MKAIKSVLANRKMFRGGGLVPSRNEMVDLNAPSGILSSSMPLIDAVESDALSAEGGTALMSQGGVARFASGGSNTDALQDIDRVRQARAAYESGRISRADLNAVMDAVLQKHGGVRNLYAKLSPEQKEDPAVREVAFQLSPAPEVPDAPIPAPPSSEGLLPLDVSAAPKFDPSAAVPLDMGFNPNVPPELQSYLAESAIRPALERQIANMPQSVAPPPVDQPAVLTPIGPPPQIIAPEIQDAPSAMFEGDISPNQGIVSAVAPSELQREERRPSGLLPSSAVSGIGDTIAENLMVEKPESVIEEAVAPKELSTLERILAEDARIQREPGFTDAGDSWKQPNWSPGGALIDKFTSPSVIEQRRSAASGLDPVEEAPSEADIAAAEQFPTVESLTREVQPAESIEEVAQGSVVEDEADQGSVVQDQEDLVIGTDSPGDDALDALQAARPEITIKSGAGDLLDDGTAAGSGRRSQAEQSAALIAEAADTDDQEDLDAKLQEHIDRFTKLMPKYEGKSEYEKGMDIVKMGMAIAAGESPNAIANISKGVLATIDNFTSDEKERRAYKQQIKLSAVKYGLANVAREHTELRADAKEGRTLFTKVFRVREGETFMHNGKELTGGETVILTVDQVRSGKVDLNLLETEDSIEAGLKAYNARLKAQLEAIGKSVVDPNKFATTSKQYIKDSLRVRTNVATQALLSNALVTLQSSDTLGLQGAYKTALLGLANALGKKKYAMSVFDGLTDQKQFKDWTNRAVTTQIEGLINEGGKISDQERDLAREIGGSLQQGIWSGVFADKDVLEDRIKFFKDSLNRDSDVRLKAMGLAERAWDNSYNTIAEDRVSYGEMLRQTRTPLSSGTTSPRASSILPGSINWKDIISVDPETNTVVGFKRNWKSE